MCGRCSSATPTTETFSQPFARLDFAPLWQALPPLASAVDPFDYRGRMAVYKTLIECMNGRGVFAAEGGAYCATGWGCEAHAPLASPSHSPPSTRSTAPVT